MMRVPLAVAKELEQPHVGGSEFGQTKIFDLIKKLLPFQLWGPVWTLWDFLEN